MRRMTYEDEARLEYGRILWRKPQSRERLLSHWTDPRHPYFERFQHYRTQIEGLLCTPVGQDDALDAQLQSQGTSLRVLVREIPPVFGNLD